VSGQIGCCRQSECNSDDTSGPSDPIKDLTQYGGANQTTKEIAGQIDTTCRATIAVSRAAHKACDCGLREECANSDEHEAHNHSRKILQEQKG